MRARARAYVCLFVCVCMYVGGGVRACDNILSHFIKLDGHLVRTIYL